MILFGYPGDCVAFIPTQLFMWIRVSANWLQRVVCFKITRQVFSVLIFGRVLEPIGISVSHLHHKALFII